MMNPEFEHDSRQVKDEEAESVIKEFEEVVSEDVEFYSIRVVLHIYKNEIQEALYVA